MRKAGGSDTEKLIAAFKGLEVTRRSAPSLPPRRPPVDHGRLCGRTRLQNGKGAMSDFRYLDGARFQMPAEEVRKAAPAE
jgi:branched-chain amino acid transport system substrate-binding protein